MDREILSYCLDSLSKAGVDKSQVILNKSKKYEINAEKWDISLLRTMFSTQLDINPIIDNKMGIISLNKVDKDSIDESIKNAIEMARNSQPDEAYDISPAQEPKEFKTGDSEPDLDGMYKLLKKFLTTVKETYPQILLDCNFDFTYTEKFFVNSNGVDYRIEKGIYSLSTMFSSKDGDKTSSFNYTGFSLKDIEKDIIDCGSIKYLLKESIDQLEAKPLEGKFVGDVIVTPDCLNGMLMYYAGTYLSDRALISGTSIFKNKLNEEVASPKFTLSSKPVSDEIADGYFITPDGYEAENLTIIDNGILKSFLLSQYGSKKTGLDRAKNPGGSYVIESGDKTLEDMIKGIDRGLLVARYSGGNPSASGDFSGVAKNSYYIENGEIKYPVSETMISGNLAQLFKNIKDVSKERVDFGASVLPWISSTGVTISGK